MISIESSGSFHKTEDFLQALKAGEIYDVLSRYGQEGVSALSNSTPVDSGVAASSWSYSIEVKGTWHSIIWHNTNIENGLPVVILLQYGHGTGSGGYVAGRDFINPAIQPIFDRISADVWKAVSTL